MTRKWMTSSLGPAAVLLGSMAVFAGTASAGTPLPNPPFTNGGFVAPDKDNAKAEKLVAGNLNVYGGKSSLCTQILVNSSTKAAGDATKLATAATKFGDCNTKNLDLYTKKATKIASKPHNSCLDVGPQQAFRASLDLQIGLLTPILFCDASGGVNAGVNYPSTKDQAKAEISVAKIAVKGGQSVGKCFSNTADAVFKAAGDATKIATAISKHNTCVSKATTKANDAIAKLVSKNVLPAGCLTQVIATTVVTGALALGGDFSDDIACASPSGAFVDGVATF